MTLPRISVCDQHAISRGRAAGLCLTAGLSSAVMMFFFDPERGRRRRRMFRDRHIPKGNLNISCEHGMVILRGELDSIADIGRIEERVRRVNGVRGVQNLLHPIGTPAPNKERSRLASELTP